VARGCDQSARSGPASQALSTRPLWVASEVGASVRPQDSSCPCWGRTRLRGPGPRQWAVLRSLAALASVRAGHAV